MAEAFTPSAQSNLPDYRPLLNPELQRQPHSGDRPLPLYGYEFFAPARQVIAARRNALQQALTTGSPIRPHRPRTNQAKNGPFHVATPDELDLVKNLTDAQRVDLLERQRTGALAPDEQQQYRIFLYPSTVDPVRPATKEEIDAIETLTLAQRADLLSRQRQGTLGPRDTALYRILLFPMPERLPQLKGAFDQDDPSASLTAEQKVDLLVRQRQGKLTAAEKQKYHTLLNPQPNAPGDNANDAQERDSRTTKPVTPDSAGPNYTVKDEPDYSNNINEDPYSPGNGSDNSGNDTAASAGGYIPPATPGVDYADPGGYTPPDATPSTARRYPRTGNDSNAMPVAQGADASIDSDPHNGQTDDNGAGDTSPVPGALPSVNAYTQIADPLATTLQQVIASAPADYQLSGGDRVTLRYSSPTMEEKQAQLTVDPQGGLNVPEVGRVIVRGMTTAQAETALNRRMGSMIRGANVSLFLQGLRTIPVTVSGASYFPGTYQVPSVATAFNILYATGGPMQSGSLRNIEIRRRGALVGTIDVYKFLSGAQVKDITLQAGDVIVIPEHFSRVAVRGEVHRPAVFELTPKETLADALRLAGGIKPSGVSQRVLVSTLEPGSARVLKNVDARELSTARGVALYDGDSVDVFSVRTRVANKVTVEGAVDQPGDYAVTDGMTVADLVDSARGLLSETYTRRADLWRFNADTTLTLIPIDLDKAMARDPAANVKLTRWDKLKVYSLGEVTFLGRRDVIVNGAVQHPGVYYHGDNMRVKDLLLQAGGTLPDAYTYKAALLHQKPDGSYQYEFVNLAQAMSDSPSDNVLLQDHDVLGVYKIGEAQFVPQHTFSIKGEVVAPGDNYPRGDGMHLSDAVHLAGGLLPSAGDRISIAHARQNGFMTPSEATYQRSGGVSPDLELQDGDVITIQGRGSWMDHPYVVTVKGAVNKPGPVILPTKHARLSDVVKLAGGLKPEAYPRGAEFDRIPDYLTTEQQKRLSGLIERLNELLNSSEYKRALAQSDVERIKAIGKAVNSQQTIGIPGITPPSDGGQSVAAASATQLSNRDLVTPPRDLTPSDLQPGGNVAVNLEAALRRPGSSDDIDMTDGDTVIVPERPTTVQVVGAVINSRGVVFAPGQKPGYYIDNAGGFAPDAAKDRILVIQVGGGLIPIKKVREIHPGDMILVPTGVMAAKISNHQNEFDSIFKSLTNSALVFFIAKKLIGF